MIRKLIWRNLWRNKRRSFITMASVTFAVMLAIVFKSLQIGVWNNMIRNVVSFYSGYIQVHKKGYWDEQVLDKSFVMTDSLDNILKNEKEVPVYSPRIESFVLAAGEKITKGSLVVGVIPEPEDKLTRLKEKLIRGKYFSADENAAVISEGLAEHLGLSVGDTVVLLGQGFHEATAAGKYPIAGIVRFGTPQLNDRLVYLPLHTAQALFGAEHRLTSIALSLKDASDMKRVKNQLEKKADDSYEIMTWEEMMPELMNQIKADNAGFYIQIGILYLIIAFGIFGTIIMMTIERSYEFGMLIAVGMKKARIVTMLLGETVLITFLGTLVGMVISLPVVFWMIVHPIRLGGDLAKVYESFGFEPIFPAEFHPYIFWGQAIVVLCIALVIGIYPLIHIKNLKPVEAMKK